MITEKAVSPHRSHSTFVLVSRASNLENNVSVQERQPSASKIEHVFTMLKRLTTTCTTTAYFCALRLFPIFLTLILDL